MHTGNEREQYELHGFILFYFIFIFKHIILIYHGFTAYALNVFMFYFEADLSLWLERPDACMSLLTS